MSEPVATGYEVVRNQSRSGPDRVGDGLVAQRTHLMGDFIDHRGRQGAKIGRILIG